MEERGVKEDRRQREGGRKEREGVKEGRKGAREWRKRESERRGLSAVLSLHLFCTEGEEAKGVWPLLLGGLAACTACIATQPIDVIKTRLMTQALSNLAPYTGARDCLLRMVKEEGAVSLFRGIGPRLLYVAPFAAVQFAVHEAITGLIHRATGGA